MTKKNDGLFPLFKKLFDAIKVGVNPLELPDTTQWDCEFYANPIQGAYAIPMASLAEVVEKCLSDHKHIGDNFSYKAVYKKIFDDLCGIKFRQEQFSEDHYKEIIKYFKSIDSKEIEILVPIYGLEVDTEEPIKIANFTIYGVSHYATLKKKLVNEDDEIFSALINQQENHVSCKVTACEPIKGYEKASILLEQLENIFKLFCYGRRDYQDVGIFKYDLVHERKHIAFSGGRKLNWSLAKEGASVPMKISDVLEKGLFTKIIEKLSSPSLNKMEKQLMIAIDFCGRASCEKQPCLGFLFCMFGLEALVQSDDDHFVSAAIPAQMTDAYAFIIAKDYKERIQCAEDFHYMYKKRCKIAHGEAVNISDKDYRMAWKYLYSFIIYFLADETISKIETMEAFKKHVQDQKFQKTVR